MKRLLSLFVMMVLILSLTHTACAEKTIGTLDAFSERFLYATGETGSGHTLTNFEVMTSEEENLDSYLYSFEDGTAMLLHTLAGQKEILAALCFSTDWEDYLGYMYLSEEMLYASTFVESPEAGAQEIWNMGLSSDLSVGDKRAVSNDGLEAGLVYYDDTLGIVVYVQKEDVNTVPEPSEYTAFVQDAEPSVPESSENTAPVQDTEPSVSASSENAASVQVTARADVVMKDANGKYVTTVSKGSKLTITGYDAALDQFAATNGKISGYVSGNGLSMSRADLMNALQ